MTRFTLSRFRRDLYRGARVLGDVQAVERGPVGVAKRVERRFLGRLFGRLLRRLV